MDTEIRQRFADIRKSVNWPVYLFDYEGHCIDSNNLGKIGETVDVPDIPNGDIIKTGKFQWISVGASMGFKSHFIALLGEDESAVSALKLIQLVFNEKKGRMDKHTVLRTMLLDRGGHTYTEEELTGLDIELKMPVQVTVIDHRGASSEEARVVCENILEKSLIVEIDRQHLALVISEQEEYEKLVETVISMIQSELMAPASAGIGKSVTSWYDLCESYSTAQKVLELGRKIGEDTQVFLYDRMMLVNLVSDVPEILRRQYFKDYGDVYSRIIDDEELIQTAIRFFENDLNITETSRQLYIHRNTLIYRLNKIEKQTGLDLRSFDAAIQFYILMLIWRLGEYEL